MRYIFRRYAELGSIRLLKEELDAQGLTSKCWTSTSGRLWGGKPFARGALYLMLQNRIYRGEIVHKERSYPGEHAPIIDRELWDTVQARLAGNVAQRNAGGRTAQPSLLAGLLFDGDGNRMTPSHAVKKGTRYRYYVSRPLITKDRADRSTGRRIPAGRDRATRRQQSAPMASRSRQHLPGDLGMAPRSISSAAAGRARCGDREAVVRVAAGT